MTNAAADGDGNLAATYSLIYAFLKTRGNVKAAEAVKKAAHSVVVLKHDEPNGAGLELADAVKAWKERKPLKKKLVRAGSSSSSSSSSEESSSSNSSSSSSSGPSLESSSPDNSDSESNTPAKHACISKTRSESPPSRPGLGSAKANVVAQLVQPAHPGNPASSCSSSSSTTDSQRTLSSEDGKASTTIASPGTFKPAKKANSSPSSNDSSSSDSSDSSDGDTNPKAKLASTKVKASKSSSSSSSSGSSSDSSDSSNNEAPKKPFKQSVPSHVVEVAKDDVRVAKKRRTSEFGNAVATAIATAASTPDPDQTQKFGRKTNVPFQRIRAEKLTYLDERLKDNTFDAKPRPANDYGEKASQDLIITRGAGFRKEKNKKKRGSYRGGEITMESHSIKFA